LNDGTIVVASASVAVTWDKAANVERVLGVLARARREDVNLLVLPELVVQNYLWKDAAGYEAARAHQRDNAEPIDGPATAAFAGALAGGELWAVVGMTEVDHDGALYSTAVLIGPTGIVGSHRKVHLASVERQIWSPGDSWSVHDLPIGRVGVEICYDKVFPESSRELALRGAEIIAIPGAWRAHGLDPADRHLGRLWEVYDVVRAAENQCWVVSANHVGHDARTGRTSHGHGQIVGPSGRVLAATDGEALAAVRVDVRAAIAAAARGDDYGQDHDVLGHRRPATYRMVGSMPPSGVVGSMPPSGVVGSMPPSAHQACAATPTATSKESR